jgi:hypothetical protein
VSNQNIVIPIDYGNSIPRPTENNIARFGPRRMVKLAPIPGNSAVPVIWTGPLTEDEIDGRKIFCRPCIVLMVKEPKPMTMFMSIPADFYEKLPDVPVEW